MPESGAYSLLILSFAVFSFVAWQLRGSETALKLGFCAGFLMLLVGARLLMHQFYNIFSSLSSRPQDLAMASYDGLILLAFVALLTWTNVDVLTRATTADPSPK